MSCLSRNPRKRAVSSRARLAGVIRGYQRACAAALESLRGAIRATGGVHGKTGCHGRMRAIGVRADGARAAFKRHHGLSPLRAFVVVPVLLAGPAAYAALAGAPIAYDPTPRIGIVIPIGPPHYGAITRHVAASSTRKYGPFTFHTGTIDKIPIVYCIQPFGGEFTRSLSTQAMAIHFHLKAVLYPGTSGAHVAPPRMLIGDVVLGAKQVNFGNFFMTRSGRLVPDEFHGVSSMGKYMDIYLNPRLLKDLACSAHRVASAITLPAWLNKGYHQTAPRVYYYGIQGTSSMWLANKAFIAKTDSVFHEVDEDGDWFSAVVSALYHIPFIEVSTISDSILELPHTRAGVPRPPAGARGVSASAIAQNISDAIMVSFIKHYGHELLTKSYATPFSDPYAHARYVHPTAPHGLLSGAGCD